MKKISLICFSILVGASFGVSANSVDTKDEQHIMQVTNLKQLNYQVIPEGFQQSIDQTVQQIDLTGGKTGVYAFKLPEYKERHRINLISKAKDGGIYYPIVFTLDKDFVVLSRHQEKLRLHSSSMSADYFEINVEISSSDRYMLITTDPRMVGKQFSHSRYEAPRVYIDPSCNCAVSLGGRVESSNYDFSDIADLFIAAPFAENYDSMLRQQTWFFEFGSSSGGDKVADNPDGDSYKVGGGAIISIGKAWLLFKDSPHWLVRVGGGIRYQGGDGRNSGVVSDVGLVYGTDNVNLILGLHGDFSNKVEDINGSLTTFKNAVGPFFAAEWRAEYHVNLGIKLTSMSYTSSKGEEFNGEQGSLYISAFF